MFAFLRKGVKKNYEIDKKEIGKGQFATVRRGVHRKTGQVIESPWNESNFFKTILRFRFMLLKRYTKIVSRKEW